MQITTTYSFGGYIAAPVLSGKTQSTIDPAVTKTTEYAVTVTYDVQRAAALRNTTEQLDAPTEPTEPADTGGVGQDRADVLPWHNGHSAEEMTFGQDSHSDLPAAQEDAEEPEIETTSHADAEDAPAEIVTLSSLDGDQPQSETTAPSLLGDTGLTSVGQTSVTGRPDTDVSSEHNTDQQAKDLRMKDAELGFAAAAISSTAAAPATAMQLVM